MLLMYLAIEFNINIEQMDVKTKFVHGYHEENFYMKQPEGFIMEGEKDFVYKLNKSLQSLKQSPRMWYENFYMYIQQM